MGAMAEEVLDDNIDDSDVNKLKDDLGEQYNKINDIKDDLFVYLNNIKNNLKRQVQTPTTQLRQGGGLQDWSNHSPQFSHFAFSKSCSNNNIGLKLNIRNMSRVTMLKHIIFYKRVY